MEKRIDKLFLLPYTKVCSLIVGRYRACASASKTFLGWWRRAARRLNFVSLQVNLVRQVGVVHYLSYVEGICANTGIQVGSPSSLLLLLLLLPCPTTAQPTFESRLSRERERERENPIITKLDLFTNKAATQIVVVV